jgi:hypothetical protein
MIKARLLAVWLFIFGVNVIPSLSQVDQAGVIVRLSISDLRVSKSRPPTATITIQNRSGAPLAMSDLSFFSLEMQLKSRPDDCRVDECYSAALFPRTKKIEPGGEIIFVTKLSDLHWQNSISAITDGSRSKNFFTGVPRGEYELYAQLSVKAANWTARDPRYVQIKSNTAPIYLTTPE